MDHDPRKIKDKFPFYPVGTEWISKWVCCSGVYKQVQKDETKGNKWEYQYNICPEGCSCYTCENP